MVRGNKELLLSLTSVALYFLALQFIATIIARYSRDIGVDITGTGIIWSSLFIVSLMLRPFSGYIADKTSSYLAMSIGALFLAIASLIYMSSTSFMGLLVGRLIQGAGNGFFVSPSIAAVATAAGEHVGTALGIRSMIISITGIVAPPIAGFIVDSLGYSLIFTIAVIFSLATFVLNGLKFKSKILEKPPRKDFPVGWSEAINKVVLLSFVAALASGGVFTTLSGILQAHYRDLGYEAKVFGYFSMVFGLSSTVSRFLAGKLTSKIHPAKIAIVGHIFTSVSTLLLYSMYHIPWSYIVAAIYGLGIGLTVPTQQLLVISSTKPQVRNRAVSIYAMGFDIGGFVAPLLFSYVASIKGYHYVYLYLSILPITAVSSLIHLVIGTKKN